MDNDARIRELHAARMGLFKAPPAPPPGWFTRLWRKLMGR